MQYIDLSEIVHVVNVGVIVISLVHLNLWTIFVFARAFGSAFCECVFWSAKVSTEQWLNLGFRTQTVSLSPE